MDAVITSTRRRLAESVRGLFAHVDEPPLAATFEHPGDPGLFGPDSVTWRIQRHPSVFVAGPRALLVQACHPEVLAGVIDHSSYEADPLGRLSRTSAYVTTSAFGAMPEVEAVVRTVRRAHASVRGFSIRGIPYSADQPALAAWVHNALVDSFLTCYEVLGPGLDPADADRYVAEQTHLGRLLGADPLPEDAAGLRAYVAQHPDLEHTRDLRRVLRFLRRPPLAPTVLAGYRVLFNAAVATLPPRLRRVTRLDPPPGAVAGGRGLVAALGWVLGEPPAYRDALARVRAERVA